MQKEEAKKILINCRSLIKALNGMRSTPIINTYALLHAFETDKMVDDLEDLLNNLNVIFIGENKK